MKTRHLPAALVVLTTLFGPVEAADANLLANGGFDDGLRSWGRTENVAWSPAFGGSARIDQQASSGWEALLQCVPVEGDALYTVSAAANLPRRADGDGGLSIRVRWMESDGCRGTILGGAPSLDFETSPEMRQAKSRVLVSPAGARSAVVQLVARADTSSSYAFVVDEVVFAPEYVGELLTLPTAASAPGARGQRFATDLWVRNASALPRRFSLRMFCPAPCGANPEWYSLILGPLETRALPDVVADVLGGWQGKAGAIEVAYDPRDGGLEVFSRVATAHEESPGNGTAIPALRRDERRAQTSFIGLSALGGDAGFRVNAGAFNPNDRATSVTFVVRDAAGRDLGVVERTWGPKEWFQINDVLGKAGAGAGEAASIFVDAGLPLFPFVISVDNRSGDPTWIPPAPEAPRY